MQAAGSLLSCCETAVEYFAKCYLNEFFNGTTILIIGLFFFFFFSWELVLKKDINILQSFVCWLFLVQLLSGRQSIS